MTIDPKLLYIETSTDTCSVAISDGHTLLGLKEEHETLNHASHITVMINELFKEINSDMKQLAGVVLSEGPGSYTSLRVGMSVAKGICYALDIPLFAVGTLEALARAAGEANQDKTDYICAMIDARRMEVYASIFDRNGHPILENQALILEENTFDSYLANGRSILCCGNGSSKAIALYQGENIRFSDLKTSAVQLIEPGLERYKGGKSVNLAYFSPNYIKSPNITKATRKLL